jgi:hypothetical protein
MVSVGRHLDRESMGKDLAIVDPVTKVPVGLLPDFLYYDRTGEEYQEIVMALYNRLAAQGTP